jgi:hypothetical protein
VTVSRCGSAVVAGLLVFASPSRGAAAQQLDALPETAACSASAGLPSSIRVPREIRGRVETMLTRSPTFREQCRRLAAAPWLHVLVRLTADLTAGSIRARSTITRPQPRLMLAVVDLAGSADPAIWLAHEFEHLVEQIDGVDLATLVADPLQAWQVQIGTFETRRAIRAGEAVSDEVHSNRRSDKFVD